MARKGFSKVCRSVSRGASSIAPSTKAISLHVFLDPQVISAYLEVIMINIILAIIIIVALGMVWEGGWELLALYNQA